MALLLAPARNPISTDRRWQTLLLAEALVVGAAGVAGAAVLFGAPALGADFRGGFSPAFGVDPLSGFFLVVLALVAVPALISARRSLRGHSHPTAMVVVTGGFCAALAGLVAARDVVSFLACWELMTLLPAIAILIESRDRPARDAVFTYLAITHIGGVGVWACMLALADQGALAGAPVDGGLQAFVAVAAIVGFGTKAGAVPFHAWLPRAHPLAPSHISALMSGVMVKFALYGLIRVLFDWAGPVPLWVGLVVLGLGALSAVGGVLYALIEQELKRLLAFSTIENVGIVLLGLGASLVFAAAGNPAWAAIAFAAALLHTLNHALFKGLLFIAAGAFAKVLGGLDLDRAGGLLRRMPWTAGAFAVGAVAIAGLPPLNGFASEWMTLQSLVHLAPGGPFGVAIAGALATVALAATAALGAYCFAKVIGLMLLGRPRTAAAGDAGEIGAPVGALAFLAGGCIALGLAPGLLVPTLAGLGPGDSAIATEPGIALPGTGGLPALGLALVLGLAVFLLWRARTTRSAAPAPAWACGQDWVPALGWTSIGFTKPLQLVAEPILRPERDIGERSHDGVVQEVTFASTVPHLFDKLLYRPVTSGALRGARFARRLQSGSLRAYTVYLLLLLALLLGAARLEVLL